MWRRNRFPSVLLWIGFNTSRYGPVFNKIPLTWLDKTQKYNIVSKSGRNPQEVHYRFNFCYCILLQNCRSHSYFFSWSLGRCNQRTTSGKCCVLPFKYRGRRYNRCAKTRRGRPWCPTGSGVYIRNQPWGYCRGGKRKDQPFLNSVSHTLNFIAISKLIQISLR